MQGMYKRVPEDCPFHGIARKEHRFGKHLYGRENFIDSEGKILGDPILGAHIDKYRELMEEYL